MKILQLVLTDIFQNCFSRFSFSVKFWVCLYYLGSHSGKLSLFKGNKKNTKKGCKICSKLTIKTPELVKTLELVMNDVLLSLLLALSILHTHF